VAESLLTVSSRKLIYAPSCRGDELFTMVMVSRREHIPRNVIRESHRGRFYATEPVREQLAGIDGRPAHTEAARESSVGRAEECWP